MRTGNSQAHPSIFSSDKSKQMLRKVVIITVGFVAAAVVYSCRNGKTVDFAAANQAKTYYELAKTEYGHVEKLHALVVKKVDEAKSLSIQPTEQMLAKWDELHKKMIAKTAEAKTYLDMWK